MTTVPEVKIHSRSIGFSIISNNVFRDRNLSLRAKGLLCTMLSLPDNWDYSIAGLLKIINPIDANGKTTPIHGQSKDALYAILAELEDHGYLLREQGRKQNGRLGRTIYHIYDTPQIEKTNLKKKPAVKRPYRENPDTVNSDTANPTQINTKENKVLKESSSPLPPPSNAKNLSSQQAPMMREFEKLCELSIKPVRTQDVDRTKKEYENRLRNGYTPEQIEWAYKKYAQEYRARNETPRYAKQLSDWLYESDGLLWYAGKKAKTHPILVQITKEQAEKERRDKLSRELMAKDPSYAALTKRYTNHMIQLGKKMISKQLSEEEKQDAKNKGEIMAAHLKKRLDAYELSLNEEVS